ncbi:MAG: sulfate adenylyltransferase, partial [Oscillatoriales cyanobacterium RU_3_3]|nr:sulfate adenylyltransferase [Oscillatoriales cyanobacterium RU_3_3]
MSQHPDGIAPHGGILVNRIATLDQRQEFFDKAEILPRVQLAERSLSDLQTIAIGALSPLEGFMGETEYRSVVKEMRLTNGLPWSVPITLPVSEAIADTLKEGTLVRLDSPTGEFAGILELTEKYRYNKEEEALNVYGTDDLKHPGVQVLDKSGPINLAGPVWLMERQLDPRFPQYQIDPAKSRMLFKEKGWKTVVGFQTRNPIHRAHEYIQKCALETVDGLFLHPLV